MQKKIGVSVPCQYTGRVIDLFYFRIFARVAGKNGKRKSIHCLVLLHLLSVFLKG